MDSTKSNDILGLIKQGLSTIYNIGQMTHYRTRYLMEKESPYENTRQASASELSQNRNKMIKYTCLAGLGILGLFAIGISGLKSRK